jgi:hypothetical protein
MTKQRKTTVLINKVVNKLASLDLYGTPVTLNVNGQSSVKSIPGFIMTWFTLSIIKFYVFRKIDVMRAREGYTISSNPAINAFGPTQTVSFHDFNFKMAWAVEDHNAPYTGLDDPTYVKYLPVIITQDANGTNWAP